MALGDPEEEGFKVTDRRRRSDQDVPSAEAPPTVVTPPSAPRPESSQPRRPERMADQGTAPSEASRARPESERNLAGLFVMLASSAAMALGEAPDPMTGQIHSDLGQAAELIDLLLLLRDKTEGNRVPEETQILEELIYDLQLRYVAVTRRPGSPPGPPRS